MVATLFIKHRDITLHFFDPKWPEHRLGLSFVGPKGGYQFFTRLTRAEAMELSEKLKVWASSPPQTSVGEGDD